MNNVFSSSNIDNVTKKLKNPKRLNFKKLLIANITLAVFIFVCLIVVLILLFVLPFPQRIMIDYMDKQMIRDGEAAFIIAMTSFVFILVPCYIALLVTSALVAYNFFAKNPSNLSFNQKWYITAALILFSLLYILIPVVFVWFFFIPYEKWVNASFKTVNLNYKEIHKNRSIWISFITVITVGIASIIPAILLSIFFPDTSKTPNRKAELQDMYTLSKDKPNTIILYFDRAYGLFWNQLLMVDYLLAHDSSVPAQARVPYAFIDEFPEFTSYVQTLSQAMVTNASNPMINGSWYFQPDFKQMDLINPFYGQNNKNTTINNWYLDSYKSSLGMLSSYGYSRFNIVNPPYYGNKSYELNANTLQLQHDLQQSWDNKDFYPTQETQPDQNSKFLSIDVTEIAKSYGDKVKHSKNDEITFLRNFASSFNNYSPSITNQTPNSKNNSQISYGSNQPFMINGKEVDPNLRVESNIGSTFGMYYFQTTHENYQYVTNEFYKDPIYNPEGINLENPDMGTIKVYDPEPNNFIVSMWYAIQKLKRVLMYLKHLPSDVPGTANQYENTNIYIISDHGTPIVNNYSYWFKINQYLINKGKMTQQQANFLDTELLNNDEASFGFWNPIFMRKPAKSISQTKNSLDNFFNQKDLYVDSDLFPIIEADVQRQMKSFNKESNPQFVESESWYYDPETKSFRTYHSNNSETQKIIDYDLNNNFLFNPINNPKFALSKRNVPLYMTEWLFQPNTKKYKIQYKYYFINKQENKGGIFNPNNYYLYKKYI